MTELNRKGDEDMPHPDKCLHEDDFRRLEDLVTKVFSKMDSFLTEIHQVMVKEAVRDEKLATLERSLDQAYQSIRSLKADVKDLGNWRQRFEGGIKVMLAIPVFCTILTTAFAIHAMMSVP